MGNGLRPQSLAVGKGQWSPTAIGNWQLAAPAIPCNKQGQVDNGLRPQPFVRGNGQLAAPAMRNWLRQQWAMVSDRNPLH